MPWLTGNDPNGATVCRTIFVPDEPAFRAAVRGALLEMTYEYNWEQEGDLSPAEAAALAFEMLETYEDQDCGSGGSEGLIGSLVIVLATDVYPENVLRCDGAVYDRVDYPLFYDYLVANSSPLIIDADTFEMVNLAATSVFVNGFGTIPAYWCWVVK